MLIFFFIFLNFRNFKKALIDVILSRRAIRNMNTLYPDATPEELALSDNICIICRLVFNKFQLYLKENSIKN